MLDFATLTQVQKGMQGTAQQKHQQSTELYLQGRQCIREALKQDLDKKKLKQASEHFGKGIQLDYKNPSNYLGMGFLFLLLRKSKEAIPYLKSALELDPHSALGKELIQQAQVISPHSKSPSNVSAKIPTTTLPKSPIDYDDLYDATVTWDGSCPADTDGTAGFIAAGSYPALLVQGNKQTPQTVNVAYPGRPLPTPVPTVVPTPTPSSSSSPSPEPSSSTSPSVEPSVEPSPTPEPTVTASSTPSPAASATPTPTPSGGGSENDIQLEILNTTTISPQNKDNAFDFATLRVTVPFGLSWTLSIDGTAWAVSGTGSQVTAWNGTQQYNSEIWVPDGVYTARLVVAQTVRTGTIKVDNTPPKILDVQISEMADESLALQYTLQDASGIEPRLLQFRIGNQTMAASGQLNGNVLTVIMPPNIKNLFLNSDQFAIIFGDSVYNRNESFVASIKAEPVSSADEESTAQGFSTQALSNPGFINITNSDEYAYVGLENCKSATISFFVDKSTIPPPHVVFKYGIFAENGTKVYESVFAPAAVPSQNATYRGKIGKRYNVPWDLRGNQGAFVNKLLPQGKYLTTLLPKIPFSSKANSKNGLVAVWHDSEYMYKVETTTTQNLYVSDEAPQIEAINMLLAILNSRGWQHFPPDKGFLDLKTYPKFTTVQQLSVTPHTAPRIAYYNRLLANYLGNKLPAVSTFLPHIFDEHSPILADIESLKQKKGESVFYTDKGLLLAAKAAYEQRCFSRGQTYRILNSDQTPVNMGFAIGFGTNQNTIGAFEVQKIGFSFQTNGGDPKTNELRTTFPATQWINYSGSWTGGIIPWPRIIWTNSGTVWQMLPG